MNRTAWLKLYDRKESMGQMMTEVWAAGVNDALYLYATSSGSSASSSPSGAATAAATADMLRSDDEVVPAAQRPSRVYCPAKSTAAARSA